ncbi:hypothetical protein NDU88_000508 [Pleurodeles waltl]|uniref:Uncharacterized protein n=1 Tax=Pleurodeles waltl TaxID=8319 RepID=A0AAV7S5G5_PLEWA|nr:hypothetical protein NDU88_000508 [Pleurodeles waltl]
MARAEGASSAPQEASMEQGATRESRETAATQAAGNSCKSPYHHPGGARRPGINPMNGGRKSTMGRSAVKPSGAPSSHGAQGPARAHNKYGIWGGGGSPATPPNQELLPSQHRAHQDQCRISQDGGAHSEHIPSANLLGPAPPHASLIC